MQNVKSYSRREMLRMSAGTLLALGLWPGALRAAGSNPVGDFHFIVANDLHYFDPHCEPWFGQVIRQMQGHPEKPVFCLIAGDLAENGTPAQLAPVRDHFKSLGMPFYCVPGNHDYLTAAGDRKAYDQLFPNRINYHFEYEGWQFVALDSTQGQASAKTRVQPETLQWIDHELPSLDKSKPLVILTHFPFGPDVMMRPLNADAVLERFLDYNLQAVFSGHFHGFTERHLQKTTLTTNRCCSFHRSNHDGTKEKGYFLCRAQEGAVSRTFVQVGL